MPETKKKRKSKSSTKKAKSKSTGPAEQDKKNQVIPPDELPEIEIADEDQVIEKDLSDMDEGELRSELQAELKRLQNEYKRQKEITSELESERIKIRSEMMSSQATTTPQAQPPAATSPSTTIEPSQYPEVFSPEPQIDQPFLSDLGIDREFIDSISNMKSELAELKSQLDNKLDLGAINELPRIEEMNRKLSENITKFNKELMKMQKDIERNDQKLNDILLDLGFEESLDINKVPYHILVMVYETILNDIVNRIRHIKGSHDTEIAVHKILEHIRSHTSGGELFKFEHNKIKIPELRQYLVKKLISPRQIHITYNSILEQLLEQVPGYSPKNFKAMIKIMSQEYALEAVIRLEENIVTSQSNVEAITRDMKKFIDKKKEKDTSLQFLQDELKNIKVHISNLTEKLDVLPQMIEVKIDEKLKTNNIKLQESIDQKTPGESPELPQTEGPHILEEKPEEPKGRPFGEDLDIGTSTGGTIVLGDDETLSEEEPKPEDAEEVAAEKEDKDEEMQLEPETELKDEIEPEEDKNEAEGPEIDLESDLEVTLEENLEKEKEEEPEEGKEVEDKSKKEDKKVEKEEKEPRKGKKGETKHKKVDSEGKD